MSKLGETSIRSGEACVNGQSTERKRLAAQELEAHAEQRDAEESAKTWGILGKVASVIAIAVSAVASVFSCGAASCLLVASCALSAMAFVEGETHALGKLTGNEDNSKWFTLGLGVSSALCGGAAGIVSSTATFGAKVVEVGAETAKISSEVVGSTVTSSEGSTAAMVLGIGGAVAGGAASVANAVKAGQAAAQAGSEALSKSTESFSTSSKTLARGANALSDCSETLAKSAATFSTGARIASASAHVVAATATATAAVGSTAASFYSADAVDAQANGKATKQQMARLDRLMQWVIDGVKETDGSHKRAMETLQGAMQTQGQTLVIASSMRV